LHSRTGSRAGRFGRILPSRRSQRYS
jgi:hypothetical protein